MKLCLTAGDSLKVACLKIFLFVLFFGLSAALIGGLYEIEGPDGKGREPRAASSSCAAAQTRVAERKERARGPLAPLMVTANPSPFSSLSFKTLSEESLSLADFKGKALLVNIWATWCLPCREELPLLDQLQAYFLKTSPFEVLAINIDTHRLEQRIKFWEHASLTALKFYADESARVFEDLRQENKIFGLPTSFLIDRAQCWVGTIAGPINWMSPESLEMIKDLSL